MSETLVKVVMSHFCPAILKVLCLQAGGHEFQKCVWTTPAPSVAEGPALPPEDVQEHDRR